MIYKLLLSNSKETLRLTEQELEKFKANVGANFIEFSEGIVNPSFVVSITIDRDASREESKRLARERTNLEISAPDERGTESMKQAIEKYKPDFLKEYGI